MQIGGNSFCTNEDGEYGDEVERLRGEREGEKERDFSGSIGFQFSFLAQLDFVCWFLFNTLLNPNAFPVST